MDVLSFVHDLLAAALEVSIIGNATAVELVWLVTNLLGMQFSSFAMILSLADKFRADRDRDAYERAVPNGMSKSKRALSVLGLGAAKSERLKLIIHFGNFLAGAVMAAVPDYANAYAPIVFAVTVWLIVSSWLLLTSTLVHLKTRYDYRQTRQIGVACSWTVAVVAAAMEARDELIPQIRRSLNIESGDGDT